MTILEIESLFKTFGPVKALNDVSLSVEEGETMAIVGQNGAGKSTLVKILTGAYQKSSGQIRLEGKDVTISSPQVAKRLGIAEVYQLSLIHICSGEQRPGRGDIQRLRLRHSWRHGRGLRRAHSRDKKTTRQRQSK